MANTLFDRAVYNFGASNIDWLNDSIAVALMHASGTVPDPSNDSYDTMDNLLVGRGDSIVSSGIITATTISDRQFGGNDVTMSSVTGLDVDYVIVYQDTGVDSTSRLICKLDTPSVSGTLPYTPTGVDVTVTFNDGPSKIFAL
jgi:hypothetical protein